MGMGVGADDGLSCVERAAVVSGLASRKRAEHVATSAPRGPRLDSAPLLGLATPLYLTAHEPSSAKALPGASASGTISSQ